MSRFSAPTLLSISAFIFGGLLLGACAGLAYDVPEPGPVTAREEPADGRYTVTYRGSPTATVAQVRDLALLRAATITLQKGGDWFEVVTDYTRTETQRQSLYQQDPFGERAETRAACGVLGCPSNARPDVGQGDVDPASQQRSFKVQSFEIEVHSGEMPVSAGETYDALVLSNELRERYRAEQNQ